MAVAEPARASRRSRVVSPRRYGCETPRVFTPPLRELTEQTSLGFQCIEFAADVCGGPGATGRSFSDKDTILESIRATLLTLPGPHDPPEFGPLVGWVNRHDHLSPEQVTV